MINLNAMLNLIGQIRNNPTQVLGSFGIPQNIMNNPREMVQHLLNSGRITQEQVNSAVQMKDNPIFKGLFK